MLNKIKRTHIIPAIVATLMLGANNFSFAFELGLGGTDFQEWDLFHDYEMFETQSHETNLESKKKILNDTYNSLSETEIAKLEKAQLLVKVDYTRNENLPEVYLYRIVKGVKPVEATAVLGDYEKHKSYFNGGSLKKSSISKVISTLEVEVDYSLNYFLWMTEDYTVWNKMTITGEKDARVFTVDRRLVKASRVKAIDGVAQIESAGEGDTLIKYYGYIDPGVSLSKEEAVEKVKAIVTQLVAQVEHEKLSDDRLLKTQVEKLERNILAFRPIEKKLPNKGNRIRDY